MNLVQTLSQMASVKKQEVVLPVAKTRAIVTPLKVGDDLNLRTSITNPGVLELELAKMIYAHTELYREPTEEVVEEPQVLAPDGVSPAEAPKKKRVPKKITGGDYYKPPMQEFFNKISYVDRSMLIWGMCVATYDTMGKRETECPECNEKFEFELKYADVLQDDSITWFDKDIPFTEYSETVTVDLNPEFQLDFEIRLPSMKNFHHLINFVSQEEIQKNITNLQSNFTMSQLIALYTKRIVLKSTKDGKVVNEAVTLQEILQILNDHVDLPMGDKIFNGIIEHFDKYGLKFYSMLKCPHCQHEYRYPVNLDVEFFRAAVWDRR